MDTRKKNHIFKDFTTAFAISDIPNRTVQKIPAQLFLKGEGGKKVAEALSNLSKFSDTSSQI